MKIETLQELFVDELKDLYSAENQIIKALPKMIKSATSDELRSAFEEHLEQTKGQVQRLEEIFESLGVKPKGKPCAGMKGLIAEGQEVMEEDATEEMMDAALIGAAQRVEHYEIAAYGTVRTLAEQLGDKEAAKLLQQTLDEEVEMDKQLTAVATSSVNQRAQQVGSSQEK